MYLNIKGLQGPIQGGKYDGCFKLLTFSLPACSGRLPQRLKRIKVNSTMAFENQVILIGLQLAGAEYPEITLTAEQKDQISVLTFYDAMFTSLSLTNWDGCVPAPEHLAWSDSYEVATDDEATEEEEEEEEPVVDVPQMKARICFEASTVCCCFCRLCCFCCFC
jgi:hypothetical protein